MTSGINSAVSGVLAHQSKVNATANNLANVNSDGYKRIRVDLEAGNPSGVQATSRRDSSPGALYPDPTDPNAAPRESSNVDLAEEMSDLILGERGFESSLKMIQTEDEMLGSLLDAVG